MIWSGGPDSCCAHSGRSEGGDCCSGDLHVVVDSRLQLKPVEKDNSRVQLICDTCY